MIAYFNQQFLPDDEIRVSPMDRGFVFGDGVYEVILAVSGVPFHLDRHLERIHTNLDLVRINLQQDNLQQDLGQICLELLKRNSPCPDRAAIYIQVTRGAAPRKHGFPDGPVTPTIYARVTPVEAAQEMNPGVNAILVADVRWQRCNIKTISLIPNVLATQQAMDAGAEEAILVREGLVTEGARTNVAAVFDGVLHTHPLGNHILPGITRGLVLEIARDEGIAVAETAVPADRITEAQECMLFSTTGLVTPLLEIDGKPIGTGTMGPITALLRLKLNEQTEKAGFATP